RRPGRRRGQAAVAVAMQAGMLALFLAARPRLSADGEVGAGAGGRWALALRVALFAGYCVWALIELFLALLSYSRDVSAGAVVTGGAADAAGAGGAAAAAGAGAGAGGAAAADAAGADHAADGTLLWGVRLIQAAVCVGMLWSLWSYDDIVSVLRHGTEDGSEDVVSNALGALCALLVLAGTVLGRSGGTVAATTRWLRLWRCYRLLGPLWSAMRTAMPYIAFPQAARPRLAGRLRLEFALYRRVIEIHDGRLVLRPYHHPAVAVWVAQEAMALAVAAGAGGDPDPVLRAALVEAATIAAALENMRCERRFADTAEAPPGDAGLVPTDLDSEVLWLSRVAWAFRRSPVIPLVLERLRSEAEEG
ncbi:MAG: MAB_1171c family putative transporter, partial [Catenulispora sp.]